MKSRAKWKQTQVYKLYMGLLRRDGSVCHLCGIEIDLTVRKGPMRMTLDHVNPKSLGGSNHAHNLRLAHQKCNAERGNKLLDDYLLAQAMLPH